MALILAEQLRIIYHPHGVWVHGALDILDDDRVVTCSIESGGIIKNPHGPSLSMATIDTVKARLDVLTALPYFMTDTLERVSVMPNINGLIPDTIRFHFQNKDSDYWVDCEDDHQEVMVPYLALPQSFTWLSSLSDGGLSHLLSYAYDLLPSSSVQAEVMERFLRHPERWTSWLHHHNTIQEETSLLF